MLKNLSVRSSHVLILARLLAGDRGASAVEVEDLLLALLIQDRGKLPDKYSEFTNRPGFKAGVDPWPHGALMPPEVAEELIVRVDSLRPRTVPAAPESEVPISGRVLRALERAAGLSRELKQGEVEPLHLLAAVMEDEGGEVARLFREAGLSRKEIVDGDREQARRLFRSGGAPESGLREDRPGARAGLVLSLAKLKAWTQGARIVKVRDLLLALLIEDQSLVAADFPEISQFPDLLAGLEAGAHTPFFSPGVARDLVARLERLSAESSEDIPAGAASTSVGIAVHEVPCQPVPPYVLVPLSRLVYRMLAASATVRDEMGQKNIEPLHLLVAVVEDKSSKAAEVLRDLGVTRGQVADFIRRHR